MRLNSSVVVLSKWTVKASLLACLLECRCRPYAMVPSRLAEDPNGLWETCTNRLACGERGSKGCFPVNTIFTAIVAVLSLANYYAYIGGKP